MAKPTIVSVLASLVMTFWISPVAAVVGALDSGSKFPFVVQLSAEASDGTRWRCSGAVSSNGLISTAAHCVWDPEHGGLVKRIDTIFYDADGIKHAVPQRRIFYPKEFEAAYSDWKEARSSSLKFMKMTLQDIAFIVAADTVEVEGFPHWAPELLDTPSCGYTIDDLDLYAVLPPPRCRGKYSQAKLLDELGDLQSVHAMAVGFGDFTCKNYDGRNEAAPDNCKSDGQRRYVEIGLVPRVTIEGEQFAAPQVWCTGQNSNGVNPVQHGDSGGPRFVRTRDGRWIFVGYTSGGDNSRECASSLFMHLDLWLEAAIFKFKTRKLNQWHGASNWDSKQAAHFFEEYLEVLSLPNAQAIPRFVALKGDWMETYTKSEGYAARKRFFEKWPVRHFKLVPGTSISSGEWGDGNISATAAVEWELKNPDTAQTAIGTSQFKMNVRLGFPSEMQLAYGVAEGRPRIDDEHCRLVSGDDAINEMECPRAKPPQWTHNGSTMVLRAEGTKREFYYSVPHAGLSEVGVKPGTMLFTGRRSGNSYSGTAYIFSKPCGPLAYAVSGTVADDDRSVTLNGEAPRVDSRCQIVSTKVDSLFFEFADDD